MNKLYLKNASFIVVLMFLFNSIAIAQNSFDGSLKLNLAPGAQLPPKFIFQDLSYKLNGGYNVNSNQTGNFLSFLSNQDIEDMKNTDDKSYQYYMKADEFYKSLSDKVKSTYTIDELWYIYTYDVTLTNRLRSLK